MGFNDTVAAKERSPSRIEHDVELIKTIPWWCDAVECMTAEAELYGTTLEQIKSQHASLVDPTFKEVSHVKTDIALKARGSVSINQTLLHIYYSIAGSGIMFLKTLIRFCDHKDC